MPEYPDNLGAITYGDGAVVLPGPDIQPGWNPLIRDYEDRAFRWRQVVGLEPSPDQGYQLAQAERYKLEITPDLGWPNVESMFEPYIDNGLALGNARLVIMDLLHIDEDLIQIGDETVQYNVPLDTMKTILAPGYTKYLWRVRAISTTGAVGDPSSIQSFKGRVIVANTDWSVNPLPEKSTAMSVMITGTKSESIAQIEVNGITDLVSYPSKTSWVVDMPLIGGRNIFDIRAIDTQGNTSEYRRVETEVETSTPDVFNYFNRFDDFGLMLDLPRLPGENNYDYRERIKDVMIHRGGPDYPGLMNAIIRELGLEYYDEAMYLAPAIDEDTQKPYDDMYCWIDARGFNVVASRFKITSHYHTINPNTGRITISGPIYRVVAEQPQGVVIPDTDYTVDDTGIAFTNPKYYDAPVHLSYTLVLTIYITDQTIGELIEEINARTFRGDQQVIATLGTGIDPDLPASGLQRFRPINLSSGTVYRNLADEEVFYKYPVRWAAAELYALTDPKFKDLYRTQWNSLFGTQYDSWAMSLKAGLHTTWGYLVADDNVWSHPEIRVSGIGTLDTVYDAPKGYWMSANSSIMYPVRMAAVLGMQDPGDGSALGYYGVPWLWLKSGVGDGDDLYVSMTEVQGDIEQEAQTEFTIVQTAASAEPENMDLGIGVVVVDSSSEVS